MSVHILLNLSNELGERDKMRGLQLGLVLGKKKKECFRASL